MFEFPRNQIKEDEWTIDPKFLCKISDGFYSVNKDFNPSMEGIECVLLALERMYEFSVHDSDCATHNMPAMPSGECDCSAIELQRYVDSDRQKTNEINILTKENRALLGKIKITENRAKHDSECLELAQMEIKMLTSKARIYPVGLQELGSADPNYSVPDHISDPRPQCKNKDNSGNCHLHNLHCNYPECEK